MADPHTYSDELQAAEVRPDNGNDRGKCGKCGQTHRPLPKCQAHSKRSHLQCGGNAIRGTDKCKWHSGSEAKARAKAKTNLERQEAEVALARLGIPLETTPIDALEQMLYEAAGNVAFYRSLVSTLPDVRSVEKGAGGAIKAVPHVYVTLYDGERDRLSELAAACAKLGLDARRVALAERQVERLHASYQAGFTAAAIEPERQRLFLEAAAIELRSAG